MRFTFFFQVDFESNPVCRTQELKELFRKNYAIINYLYKNRILVLKLNRERKGHSFVSVLSSNPLCLGWFYLCPLVV